MLDALKYHFRHLADFSGRDARQTFWYWFLFLFILNMAISFAVSIPVMVEAMQAGFEAARIGGDPGKAQAMVASRMAGSMGGLVGMTIVLGLANVALIAAAFVRRLHDSGKSGYWALLTGLIYLVSLYLTWSRMGQVSELMQEVATVRDPMERMALQADMAKQSLIGYVPLIMLVVFGVMKSDPAANRYGEEPVRF